MVSIGGGRGDTAVESLFLSGAETSVVDVMDEITAYINQKLLPILSSLTGTSSTTTDTNNSNNNNNTNTNHSVFEGTLKCVGIYMECIGACLLALHSSNVISASSALQNFAFQLLNSVASQLQQYHTTITTTGVPVVPGKECTVITVIAEEE
jgi:hypothetical protein